ncbi:BirA family biotin operon repressor/biotin-[acetyl-CoA-carboxylase] ligase [Clostridium acetobutylicum]|uniref:Biotin-(Acetyl-CoA carboxylase)ligase n=1 Tax=Clostridium acetobutylicum (strain ATCC 824 / DSM 792 / JCM 1419 / IAM 19013 / LMG 5710 / NBRC 13948 / NRRL B-527 / VKM B-1787 / 2291 / W) TaxID=272562 RepID=Q97LH2_CLOAB|nr:MULTISPECIES: biotin--[acetyl-CoA-carboxylase] ligase [Clostridium]AAK78567.1 Biotin-(acetyl-CoA carboxylase)ligase [Clostridium acetobutylicum ATCC 824]ADZ19641.1 Biotin-(acetyl-CoA carboxylase)ligase [Clostridium acetobutylicum EA 2018]AEI34715.1 biotin-(acetyl-CoA carboxylase)ligase [Clostridium acetobutylicum DSM 1731]AWV80291.1 biotin--[acetyl-CoA-carboxylase] ligase [Clostridium acetobutylicum]MBC2392476.1 biotin--[acetyl-CoA-carboxylase] ligase [Clostridium acetobutylicum]
MERGNFSLNINKINSLLTTKYIGRNLILLDSIDSTNLEAKRLIMRAVAEGSLIISEEQTLGKCRFSDRTWSSPKYKGLWMSLILKPNVKKTLFPLITQLAAASLTNSFNKMNINCLIKWPNDILLNNKKLVGILAEVSEDINNTSNIILGIGINVNQDYNDFSPEISKKATSLRIELNEPISRETILSNILNDFEIIYENFLETQDPNSFLDICKKNSALIGKEIAITKKDHTEAAKVIDISRKGELVVTFNDGHTENLISGEVTLNKFY